MSKPPTPGPPTNNPAAQPSSSSSSSSSSNPDPSIPDLQQVAKLGIPLTSPVQVTAYLNDHFPTEATLINGLSDFLTNLENAQHRIDADLTSLIRNHRHDTAATKRTVRDANATLTDLKSTLSTLTTSATAARADIDTALAPAIPVHTALTNVTGTAQALENLLLLDDAVLTLEQAAQSANLHALAANVRPFTDVATALRLLDALPHATASRLRKLPSLRARSVVVRETLRTAILSAFKKHSDVISHPSDAKPHVHAAAIAQLQTACAVAEAMGTDVRAGVIGNFVRRRRASFTASFSGAAAARDDTQGLAHIDKRLTWLRRELHAHWARVSGERVERGWGSVFPSEWEVARRLADGIVAELRDWTVATLHAGADRDVAVMVSALAKAKDFETELDRRFRIVGGTQGASSFVGAMSDCYGPWMETFVAHEDAYLTSVLQELVREETWTCEHGDVVKSATELFLVIKKSMRTCAALDVRQPLFSLHRSFKKHLSTYAATLMRNLPGVAGSPLADSRDEARFDQLVNRACAIVNTAQYCATTIEQLEESLRKTVQEAYANDIDMNLERERFGAVCAKGVQSVVALVEEDLEGDLKGVSERDWASWNAVGDASAYVNTIGNKLTRVTKSVHEQLSSKQHFRFALEKVAGAFMAQLKRHLYKCEHMNSVAAQQVLLDVTTLKGILVGLPASVHAATATTFLKFVNREMGKVEAVLKVILAPLKSCVDTYVALISQGSAEDLQRVLGMRGLKRAEAAPLVLDYTRRIGPAQRLKPVGNLTGRHVGGGDGRAVGGSALGKGTAVSKVGANGAASSGGDGGGQGAGAGAGGGQGGGVDQAVDSVRNLFGRLGSSLIDTGISDRLEQVSSQFESTTGRLKREAATRWSLFGN